MADMEHEHDEDLVAHMSGSIVTVATCNLNQWALDFDGNFERVLKSCREAKRLGATYRLGPELELCGYGCEDHFFEADTYLHCWESLSQLFQQGATDDLLCDFGMPILRGGVRYNCRVLCYNRKVLLVRPKLAMADNGNYRESRYFTAYRPEEEEEDDGCKGGAKCWLPQDLFAKKFGQTHAPFGAHAIQCSHGVTVGVESCEELWTPQATHIDMALSGVDIVGNGSGSHHELRKLNSRLELMVSATRKCGGVYLYANQRGCDGGRLYYDGCAMIVCNGHVLAQADQFSVEDVQVVAATVDLEDVKGYRASIPSFGVQAAHLPPKPCLVCQEVDLCGGDGNQNTPTMISPEQQQQQNGIRLHKPEEECLYGPACWLWDYLRRSGASGYFIPLSGGADSSSVALIVSAMCHLVTQAAQANPTGAVAQECRRVCRKTTDTDTSSTPWTPRNSQEMANLLCHTTFMGTSNSSQTTQSRAARLAEAIGGYHFNIHMDALVTAVVKVFELATGKVPQFLSRGGTHAEDVALQNIQARLRMVMAYLLAQLLPWVRSSSSSRKNGEKSSSGGGFLLVLGSANVDEGLRGYMTKYDCSSADLNPIGAISKVDLRRMLLWASKEFEGFEVLEEIARAPPTAELRPMENGVEENGESGDGGGGGGGEHSQTDEEDMGMTYEELGYFGRLRKISRCGPVSMFRKLQVLWSHLPAAQVAAKVKRFFFYYAINRHKMCTVTPAYHAEAYSPDDNRFDLRPFLYNAKWTRQFRVMDVLVGAAEGREKKKQEGEKKEGKVE